MTTGTPRDTSVRSRRASSWSAWGVAGGALVATALRVLGAVGLPDHWVTVPLLGAYPWVALGTGVAALVAVGLRVVGTAVPRRAVAVLVVTAVVGAAMVIPRTTARPQPAADGTAVTVGLINVRRGLASASRIVELVETEDVDVLVLIELTGELDMGLWRAGLHLPEAVVAPTDTFAGGGVHADGDIDPPAGLDPGGDTPDVTITFRDGSQLELITTHPLPPIGPRRTQGWRDGLDRIPAPPRDVPAVVAGDLNATLDHSSLRDVLDRGWRDAAREAGAGLAVTYDGFLGGSPAVPMPLDHVLVGPGIAVDDVRTHDVQGTDHRMLVVDLTLPAA